MLFMGVMFRNDRKIKKIYKSTVLLPEKKHSSNGNTKDYKKQRNILQDTHQSRVQTVK
jgi:hypothetical protein